MNANAMSVDVEDYFQVAALAAAYPRECWDEQPQRVGRNTHRVLDLFARHGVKATFFTLGWVAERHPELVRRIVDEGHELASHGYDHRRVTELDAASFREDLARAKGLLEDLGGVPVKGYRAPSFSIDQRTPWAAGCLAETGHRYSSSVYPVKTDHYGMPDAPREPYYPEFGLDLLELPLATARFGGRNVPVAGGGYFRLLPYAVSKAAMRRVNRRDGRPCIFYCHPWEIDPDQPRQRRAGARSAFRHYVNLHRMAGRLRALGRDFAWDRMDRAFAADIDGA